MFYFFVLIQKALICTTAVLTVTARPQNGYNYNAPIRGSGALLSSGSASSSLSILGSNNNNFLGNQLASGFGSNTGFQNSLALQQQQQQQFLQQQRPQPQQQQQQQPQQTIVQKHIYVHVPPPDNEEFLPQRQITAGVAQKHYKIIFIKAPSFAAPSQAQISLAAENQEKTIVYVLVRKPDDLSADLTIPTAAPTKPSKPEVYFIKYKTQKEGDGNLGGGTNIVTGGTVGSTLGGSNTNVLGLGNAPETEQIPSGTFGLGIGQQSSGSAIGCKYRVVLCLSEYQCFVLKNRSVMKKQFYYDKRAYEHFKDPEDFLVK